MHQQDAIHITFGQNVVPTTTYLLMMQPKHASRDDDVAVIASILRFVDDVVVR